MKFLNLEFDTMDVIVTHGNADFDALASLVAAQKLYPKAKIVLPSMQERSVRDFMSMVKDVLHLEQEKDIDFKKMTCLIIVDTRLKSRIGMAANYLNNPDLKIHCYDHHLRTQNDLKIDNDVYAACGATITLLVEIIKKRNISLTPLEATIFALGIYEDTGSLTFLTTTKKDIDMVSFLFSQGANLSLIAACLNRELTESELHLLSLMIDATKIYRVCGIQVAISSVTNEIESCDLAWVIHKLLDIENFSLMFALVKTATRIQLIARSRLANVDVAKIANLFGGGGHASAASATIRGKSAAQISNELIEILKKNIKSNFNAEDIMSYPVKTLSSSQKVDKALAIIDEFKLKAIPVVDEKEKLVGMISRADAQRAINNGYGHAPVTGYMKRQLISVSPRTSVEELKEIITSKNIGRIPVLSKGNLVGMVCRTDVFKGTHKDILMLTDKRHKSSISQNAQKKDLSKKIEKIVPVDVQALLKKIGRLADKQKINAYVVGGFVRDLVMGRPNFDMDIVLEGDAINFAKALAEVLNAKLKIHQRFKTAKLNLENGLLIDIATARTEYYEYPAALPVVESSSLVKDLYRRDFTINTLALGLNKKTFGLLIDFFKSSKDLKAKRIRVLHDLSFVEDPTRILRAVRFEQRLDFIIDRHTENLICAAVDLEMFGKLHKFRIGDELVLLLNEPHPIKVIRRMHQLHELKFIHPKIKFNPKMLRLLEAVEEVLGWHKISFVDKAIKRWIVYLLVILDELGPTECQQIFNNFSFKKNDQALILQAKKRGDRVLKALHRMKLEKPSKVYELLSDISVEVCLFLMAKTNQLNAKEMFTRYLSKYAEVKLEISGNDLKKQNAAPGPHFKAALKKTLYAKLDGKLSTKEEEIRFARKSL
ncbi:MAG: CBS domain-containing protein [Candidatus Omnitrophota bacterium]